jgi:hypothetical protein
MPTVVSQICSQSLFMQIQLDQIDLCCSMQPTAMMNFSYSGDIPGGTGTSGATMYFGMNSLSSLSTNVQLAVGSITIVEFGVYLNDAIVIPGEEVTFTLITQAPPRLGPVPFGPYSVTLTSETPSSFVLVGSSATVALSTLCVAINTNTDLPNGASAYVVYYLNPLAFGNQ